MMLFMIHSFLINLDIFIIFLKTKKKFPIGLFNSVFHNKSENIIEQNKDFSLRKTCPGVSQCYDRNMVEIMVNFLNHNPFFETIYGFDYYCHQLKVPFIQSNTSFLEHFARDRK